MTTSSLDSKLESTHDCSAQAPVWTLCLRALLSLLLAVNTGLVTLELSELFGSMSPLVPMLLAALANLTLLALASAAGNLAGERSDHAPMAQEHAQPALLALGLMGTLAIIVVSAWACNVAEGLIAANAAGLATVSGVSALAVAVATLMSVSAALAFTVSFAKE